MGFRIFASGVLLSLLIAAPSQASTIFSQGFETDSSGWSTGGGSYGAIQILSSDSVGISAFEGSHYAQFIQTDSGPYTFFDGSRSTYPGQYYGQIAIYLDPAWALGSGFDYSMASYNTSGGHLQDFIFHVTKDTSTGDLLVGGSNNTNFAPREDLENINNYTVTNAGWYLFEHLFRDDGGVLAVDLILRDALGTALFTETRTKPENLIPSVVGGNGYAWFTTIDVDGGIAVDALKLEISAVPVPAALPLMLSGLAAFGLLGRRRNRKAS